MNKFNHGDIVSCMSSSDPGWVASGHKDRVLCIVLYVDIQKNPNFIGGDKSGLYMFRGQWYGNNKLNIKSFGKCYGLVNEHWYQPIYKVGSFHNFKSKLS